MNDAYEKVKEFHRLFEHGVAPGNPSPMLLHDRMTRIAFMKEEVREFQEAITTTDQVDALIDLIYFSIGTLVMIGVPPEEVFNIVHEANMQKLHEDGRPRWHSETGKVIKPDGWKSPEPLIQAYIESLCQ